MPISSRAIYDGPLLLFASNRIQRFRNARFNASDEHTIITIIVLRTSTYYQIDTIVNVMLVEENSDQLCVS